MPKEHYFVKIDESVEVRRKLLESSKLIIQCLKGYYQLLAIRKLKREIMENLKREIKELTIILNKVESDLPIISEKEVRLLIEPEVKQQPQIEKKMVKFKEPQKVEVEIGDRVSKEVSRLAQLENALKNVEQRLKNL